MNEQEPDAASSKADRVATPSNAPSPARMGDGSWERTVLERLATAALTEQRRARRWGIFFKFVFIAYVTALLIPHLDLGRLMPKDDVKHTALVEISGVIAPGSEASADRVITGLRAAFEDEDTAGIVVRINSGGGSPVQSAYINDEIRRLRGKHPEIPLYAVITDVCASGGYYIAAAADKIYADKGSIVGSIGVLMNGFGFVDAMEKLGIERRLVTAGEHKGFLDPFSPARPEDLAHLQGVLDQMHQQFIDTVKQGRGDRLKGSDEELFSGYVWTGARSIDLGLVDELGTASAVARDVIGEDKIVNFTVRESVVQRVIDRLGMSIARGVLSFTRGGWGW